MTVRIQQYESPHGPDCSAPPLPLNHGFSAEKAYQVHGFVMESGELRLIIVNDQGQVWSISNRHCLVVERRTGFLDESQWGKIKIENPEDLVG